MRNPGLKGILLAVGIALAGTAAAAPNAPVVPAPKAEATKADASTAGASTAAPATSAAPAAANPADPTLAANGAPLMKPQAGVGVPVPGAISIQPQVTKNGERAQWFHNAILLPIITVICLFVLALLLWVVARYRRAANPTPSRTSHNTLIEIIWTAAPVLILAGIAIPSISLLAAQFKPAPDGAVTLKAIGNQWFWSYEYPDHGGISLTSNLLKEKNEVEPGQRYRTDADGPRLLATDQRVVLPVGVPIRLIATANDVIHSWAIPAFWIKMDAVPGRLNETSFTIEKPGVYYGQCSELCGARHAYMPITVEAVPPAVFAQWVRAKGGTMPVLSGAKGAVEGPGAVAPSSAAPAQPGADVADDTTQGENATDLIENASAPAATTNQAATANPGGLGNVDQ